MLTRLSLLLLTLTSISLTFLGQVNADDGTYNYPITNAYYATLTNLAINPVDYKYSTANIEPKPERRGVVGDASRTRLQFTYNIQNPSAPLVFIVSGLGGTAQSATSLLLAQLMTKMGYNAVTVANPFSWQFALSTSRNGLVGYAPNDADDLYSALKLIHAQLVKSTKLNTNRFGVIGFSLGALHTGFLLKLDKQEQYFNFERTLMINSPIDIKHSMQVLDDLYDVGNTLSPARRHWVMGYVLDIYDKFKSMLSRGLSIIEILPHLKLTEADVKWLIGETYRQSLIDVILASQQLHDIGILKHSMRDLNARTEEARQISFQNYLGRVFHPQMGADRDLDYFFDSGSLTTLLEFFKNEKSAFLMHNEDDFLFQPELKDSLQNSFGDRLFLFSRGGHLGNLWYPDNLKIISRIMSNL